VGDQAALHRDLEHTPQAQVGVVQRVGA
jgi:hypothetical protein